MKHTVKHKVTAVLMAFFVMLSTFSMSITKHLCFGDNQVEVLVVEDCCDTTFVKTIDCCDLEQDCSQCLEQDITLDSVDELQQTSPKLDILIAYIYLQLYQSLPKQTIPHQDYVVPLLTQDLTVENQVFLI